MVVNVADAGTAIAQRNACSCARARQTGERVAQRTRHRLPVGDFGAGHRAGAQRHGADIFEIQRAACARALAQHDQTHVLRTHIDPGGETLRDLNALLEATNF